MTNDLELQEWLNANLNLATNQFFDGGDLYYKFYPESIPENLRPISDDKDTSFLFLFYSQGEKEPHIIPAFKRWKSN